MSVSNKATVYMAMALLLIASAYAAISVKEQSTDQLNISTGGLERLRVNSSGITVIGAFYGAGTGLTGTASGLSIGGNAATATDAGTLDSIDSASFLRSDAADTATGKIEFTGSSVGVTYGIDGKYTENASAAYGGSIWVMDAAYMGGIAGPNATPPTYGLMWIRGTHQNASADIGEGIYVFQGGTLEGGIGTSGIYSVSTITGATIDTGSGAKEIGDTVGNCAATDVHKGDGGCEAESSLSVASATSATSATSADDLSCTDCIGATEISDVYLLNTGDTATGSYTFDTNTLYIDSTNDRVGVGITNPQGKLQVNGSLTATGFSNVLTSVTGTELGYTSNKGTLRVGNSGTLQYEPMSYEALNHTFLVDTAGGTTGMTISSTGTVTAPAFSMTGSTLTTAGSADSYGSLTIDGSKNAYSGIEFADVTSGGNTLMVHNTANVQGFHNGSAWVWYFDEGALTAGTVPWGRVTGFTGDADASNDITTSSTWTGGDLTGTGLAATVAANSVALGTDTTGNYAGSTTEGGSATNAFACSGDTVCDVTAVGLNSDGANYFLGGGVSSGIQIRTWSETRFAFGANSLASNISFIDGRIIVGTGTAGSATGQGDVYVTSDVEVDGNLYVDGQAYGVAPSMYLTSTASFGDHNCDDTPSNCCATGYHLCTLPELTQGGREVEYSGTGRLTSPEGNNGDARYSGACTGYSTTSGNNRVVCSFSSAGAVTCTTGANCAANWYRWCCSN